MPGVCACIRHSSRTVVEAVQLSGQVTSFQVPSEIMGSINSEGASGLHHPNGLVFCEQQWWWRAVTVRYLAMGVVQELCVCVRACVCV